MDRIAPTRRPEGRNDGTQRWRELLFIHWPVPVEAVRPLLPARLTPDTFDGTLYIGIVPFRMESVAPRWLPDAMAFNFLETNLRTYVHLDGEAPGVWFFSLEAASWLAVRAARIGWSLPYHDARMSLTREGEQVHYESMRSGRHKTRFEVSYSVGDALPPSEPGTLQHFLLERYLLYSERGGRLCRGQVHHSPYPAHQASVHEVHDELCAAVGLPSPVGLPTLVHYAPGVDVEVFGVKPV